MEIERQGYKVLEQMAIRGRKPKPTNLKVIEGNPGHRPLNSKGPNPKTVIGDPPDHLGERAKAEWFRRAPELSRLNVLTGLDVGVFAAYCQSYAIWEQAVEALNAMAEDDPVTRGLMVKTSNGNAIQNPLLGTANKAAADMARYAAEFGMTPSARSRLSPSGQKDDNPFKKLG